MDYNQFCIWIKFSDCQSMKKFLFADQFSEKIFFFSLLFFYGNGLIHSILSLLLTLTPFWVQDDWKGWWIRLNLAGDFWTCNFDNGCSRILHPISMTRLCVCERERKAKKNLDTRWKSVCRFSTIFNALQYRELTFSNTNLSSGEHDKE